MLLEQERTKVIEIALKIQKEKLIPLTFGNFSLRDPETGYVCITPSGMPYETLHPSDIVVVSVDNQIIEGERRSTPSIHRNAASHCHVPQTAGCVRCGPHPLYLLYGMGLCGRRNALHHLGGGRSGRRKYSLCRFCTAWKR